MYSRAFWRGFWWGMAAPVFALIGFILLPFGGTAARFGAWVKDRQAPFYD